MRRYLSQLQFLEKFLAKNFALSDAEAWCCQIEDLFRTLLAIWPKSSEPSFWKVMDSIVLYGIHM